LENLEENLANATINCLEEAEKIEESPFKLFLPRLMINTPENTLTESFVRKLVEGEDLDN